jgi:tRNA-Thr(GGU) m(6)t(6)A37 methyltransferase TsaA
LRPIGFARTPFKDKKDAPRQSAVSDASGTIELEDTAEMRDALADLATWTHIWIVYVFHERGEGWSPKVQPPRSEVTRGVLATRSPHRPNPIGLSAVRLDRIDGCTLHVTGVDMIDGTPVLDIKPYVPYTDAIDEASDGWLRADPEPPWSVEWAERASEQVAWLASQGVELREPIEKSLALGPEPHAYRRIKKDGGVGGKAAWQLAIKDWRARFEIRENRTLRVLELRSGWRLDQATGVHRAFIERA